MGQHDVGDGFDGQEHLIFCRRLLTDLQALEQMLHAGLLESGVERIGAEQELFLVDREWRPAPLALEVLEQIADHHFTTEVGRFNLEFNLDPIDVGPDCLGRLEEEIESLLAKAREAAGRLGAEVVLAGILPTLLKSDLGLENLTPLPRYRALNDAMRRLRGQDYYFRIKGRDELLVSHDSVMVEACNSSFQVHLQVSPERFADLYNVAQAVAAPVLAAATNSPLLFGRSLWRETRIALFQQAADTRATSAQLREAPPRVGFGRQWLRESPLEIFREDLARFRVLLATEIDEDPFEALRRGQPPALRALRLHNGTVWRWNRPCYGVCDGRPHLRIENRVLPAGPTVLDQVANAAFWFGLMKGVPEAYGDLSQALDFGAVRENFVSAARLGLRAQFTWLGRESFSAEELILSELLDVARQGLEAAGIRSESISRYLGVVEERVRSRRTGSQWLLDSLAAMKEQGTRGERLAALTGATCERQKRGVPVALWEPARLEEAGGARSHYLRVGQLMTSDVFTVSQGDLVDLVAYLMHWRHIRHVPVEDDQHRLVGLVTHRSILQLVARTLAGGRNQPIPVSEVMQRKIVTVTPETPTLEAIALMRQHRISCLPVVQADRSLVGIISERDFMGIASRLLEDFLRVGDPASSPAPAPSTPTSGP